MTRVLINERDNQHPPVWEGPFFQIISYDHEHLTHHDKNRHFKHAVEPQYLVCLIEQGAITYENQSVTRKLKAGSLYFVPQPSQTVTSLAKNDTSSDYYWVLFKGRMAIDCFSYLTRRFGFIHENLDLAETQPCFELLFEKIKNVSSKHEVSIYGYELFHGIWELIASNHQGIDLDLEQAPSASTLLGLDCMTFKDYANKLGYSPSHLSRELKKSWGKSPGKTLRNMRLDEAARLLKSTNMSAYDIGQKVGYNSASSFNRAFSIRFGKTPMKYRKTQSD